MSRLLDEFNKFIYQHPQETDICKLFNAFARRFPEGSKPFEFLMDHYDLFIESGLAMLSATDELKFFLF